MKRLYEKILYGEYKKSVIIILSLAIFIILSFRLLFEPRISKVLENEEKVILIEGKVENFQRLRERKSDLENTYQDMRSYVSGTEKNLMMRKDIPSILQVLDAQAFNNDLKLTELTSGSLEEGPEYDLMQQRIVMKGEFEQFIKFLEDLQRLPYFFKIESLQINYDEVITYIDRNAVQLEIDIIIAIYLKTE